MVRTLVIAAAALAVAAPAFAEDAKVNSAASAAFGQELAKTWSSEQARQQLARQGYTAISELNVDEDGRFVGTAQKDGKTLFVAVDMPHPQQPATN